MGYLKSTVLGAALLDNDVRTWGETPEGHRFRAKFDAALYANGGFLRRLRSVEKGTDDTVTTLFKTAESCLSFLRDHQVLLSDLYTAAANYYRPFDCEVQLQVTIETATMQVIRHTILGYHRDPTAFQIELVGESLVTATETILPLSESEY